MFIETVGISLVTAKLRGGRLENLGKVNIRAWYFLFTGVIIELVPNLLSAADSSAAAAFFNRYFLFFHVAAYILIFTVLILNFDKKSIRFVFAGALLNFAVIAVNGGHMPVSANGLEMTGLAEAFELSSGFHMDLSHSLINHSTRLPLLADIIPLPKPYPLPKLLSIGDIIMALGVFLFLQEAMVTRKNSAA